jgi:hypothetical protein
MAYDWKSYYSAEVSSEDTNGGEQSWNEIPSGVEDALFPLLEESDLISGVTQYRKVFARNDSDDVPYNARMWLSSGPTAGGDRVRMWPATAWDDTQGDLTGSERKYGAADLKNDVSSGTTIVVTLQDTGFADLYQDGDLIYLYDSSIPQLATYTISGAPSLAGYDLTITLTSAIIESWTAANTIVASVYESGNLAPTIDNVVKTTTSGTLDEGQIVVHGAGVEEEELEVTFSSPTAFDVTMGGTAIGSGTVSGDFTGTNPDNGSANVVTIPSSAWGGTWAVGETVTGDLHVPGIALWEERIVPAGATAPSGNIADVAISYQYAS